MEAYIVGMFKHIDKPSPILLNAEMHYNENNMFGRIHNHKLLLFHYTICSYIYKPTLMDNSESNNNISKQ